MIVNQSVDRDVVYQISTYGALFEGVLDGFISLKELRTIGDFGIGGITGLDGEILLLDGNFYHIKEDGTAGAADEAMMSSKMLISFFKADKSIWLDRPMKYQNFQGYLESLLPTKNIMYAVKIVAHFKYIKTKCFPKQIKPYPNIITIAPLKKIHELKNVKGILAGYVMPEHLNEIFGAKFHFHYLSTDKRFGGHLLDFELFNGTVEIDGNHNLKLILPHSTDYYKADLTKTAETFKKVVSLTMEES